MTVPALIYIHGFNSSPQSFKAQQLMRYLATHPPQLAAHFPALPYDPPAAIRLLRELAADYQDIVWIGSSLGGFYATWLAETLGGRAVLINPAVRPWHLLNRYSGQLANYHTGELIELAPQWADALQAYEVPLISDPSRFLVLLQTGDETLDWQDAWQYYQSCHLYRGLGGSHGFDHFEDFIPLILRFGALM